MAEVDFDLTEMYGLVEDDMGDVSGGGVASSKSGGGESSFRTGQKGSGTCQKIQRQ